VRVADLVEAEGRSFSKSLREEGRVFKAATTRLGFATAALIVSGVFFAIGFLVCLAALFLALQPPLGTPAAAALTGALAIAIGCGLLIVAQKMSQ